MALVAWLTKRVYQSETVVSPTVLWRPSLATRFRAVVDSTTFTDPATVIVIVVEESFDGGASWKHWFTLRWVGDSARVSRGGANPTFLGSTAFTGTDRQLDTRDRLVRATLTVTGSIDFGILAEQL